MRYTNRTTRATGLSKMGCRITTLVSEEIFEGVKNEAMKAHRSLSAQVSVMLENGLPAKSKDPLLNALRKNSK